MAINPLLEAHTMGALLRAAKALRWTETLRRHGLGGVRGALPRQVRTHDFGRAVARAPADSLRSGRVIAAEDRSSLFCTGGTTGLPRIAVRRHGHEVARAPRGLCPAQGGDEGDAEGDAEELLSFLAGEIAERAAMPKAIRVIETMTLTAVGKIYKPALKRLEIETSLSEVLRNTGIQFVRLDAVEDASRGLSIVARIARPEQRQPAASVLGQYVFPYAIEVVS